LEKRKIFNSTVIPVGLDTGILKTDYNSYDSKTLKLQYGYDENDRILLYIGRFCEEKQPIRMIEIFNNLSKKHNGYKLIMVGKGEQEQIVCSAIKNNKIENKVQIIDSIPNNQVWELYRISDAVINLNQQEIFGMVILEAMYYECKVVAWDAPGPDMIIENGISGWIVSDNESVIEKILDTSDVSKKAHERIVNKFTWEHSAYIIQKLIKEL
jgi:1,2-diacylglycerol 3-alpha-glucosyltransferase